LDLHRCKTALYYHRHPLPEVAKAGRVSVRHLNYVLAGHRPGSQRVYEALRNALGPAGWAYATCESNTLTDEEGDHAA
jgi:hypothetical protein